MATQGTNSSEKAERLDLRADAWPLYMGAISCGAVGMITAVILGYTKDDRFRQFFFAYLAGYFFFLTIALGGLFFTILQHLTKAGWSVNVRRVAEWLASSLPVMAALGAPMVVSIVLWNGDVYPWASMTGQHAINADPALWFKQTYLSEGFAIGRIVAYFAIWSWLGVWYWKQSIKQDQNGDINLTLRMQRLAPIAMILFGLTVTLAAWDLIMTLNMQWYSTIFGVYIFAGSTISIFASIILIVRLLQSRGFLQESVTVEHYHDLGKWLFGFVFFFGYIAFDQYMLQWYGDLSDEIQWFQRRGATTAVHAQNAWTAVTLMILFGHILIPFAGLLSRHVKRNLKSLSFWAVWLLVFHWIDMQWVIKPEMDDTRVGIGLMDLAIFLGIGGVFVATVLRRAAHDSLRPLQDPRLAASLAFENV